MSLEFSALPHRLTVLDANARRINRVPIKHSSARKKRSALRDFPAAGGLSSLKKKKKGKPRNFTASAVNFPSLKNGRAVIYQELFRRARNFIKIKKVRLIIIYGWPLFPASLLRKLNDQPTRVSISGVEIFLIGTNRKSMSRRR